MLTTGLSSIGSPGHLVEGLLTSSSEPERVKHEVEGRTVTLVVQVPGAGTLTVSGVGVRVLRTQVAKAETVTLRMALSKAGAASLRRHRQGLRIKLDAGFVPVSGTSSSATTTVKVG